MRTKVFWFFFSKKNCLLFSPGEARTWVNHKGGWYDLKDDPNETTNLAAPGFVRSAAQQTAYVDLMALLAKVKKTRLQTLA